MMLLISSNYYYLLGTDHDAIIVKPSGETLLQANQLRNDQLLNIMVFGLAIGGFERCKISSKPCSIEGLLNYTSR